MEKHQAKDYLLKGLDDLRAAILLISPIQNNIRKLNLEENVITGGYGEPMIPLDSIDLLFHTVLPLKNPLDKSLARFFCGYLLKAKTLNFDEDAFSELFDEQVYFENSGRYIFRTIGCISNLELNEEIQISPEVRLIYPNKEQAEFLYNYWVGPGRSLLGGSGSHLADLSFYMSKAYIMGIYEATSEKDVPSIRPTIEKLIKSLMLNAGVLKKFAISTMYTYSYLSEANQICRFDYFDNPAMFLSDNYYRVEKNAIQSTIQYLDRLSSNASLSLSLDRMSQVKNRDKNEDKYLDIMIALEALFPTVDKELNFRLSLLVAALLESRGYYYKLKALYGPRNQIAHGSTVSLVNMREKGKITFEEALLMLDDIYRKCISNCIKFYLAGGTPKGFEDFLIERLFVAKSSPEN